MKLVKVGANWCSQCKALIPIMDRFAERNPNVKVVDLDADDEEDFIEENEIMSLPTLILYKDDKEVWRHSGMLSLSKLEEIIHKYE